MPNESSAPVVDATAAFQFKRHYFRTITDPSAGRVKWLIDGVIPAGDAVLWAATWKTAKTLCAYRLALDALLGKPAWGRHAVAEPLKIAIFQLEMPWTEDERRFRRLSIGLGVDPAEIIKLCESNRLLHYSRMPLDLSDANQVAAWQAEIFRFSPHLVILDSAVAAFCSINLNDNSAVRAAIARAILPLTERGIAVLLLHHFRKVFGAADKNPDKKSFILGAQAFGAACSRIYAMERLTGLDSASRAFTVELSMLGGWTPNDNSGAILRISDTDDDTGTMVEAVDAAQAASVATAKVTQPMLAARALRTLVLLRGRIGQAVACNNVQTESGYSDKTIERALDYGEDQGWFHRVPTDGACHGEQDLEPCLDPSE